MVWELLVTPNRQRKSETLGASDVDSLAIKKMSARSLLQAERVDLRLDHRKGRQAQCEGQVQVEAGGVAVAVVEKNTSMIRPVVGEAVQETRGAGAGAGVGVGADEGALGALQHRQSGRWRLITNNPSGQRSSAITQEKRK